MWQLIVCRGAHGRRRRVHHAVDAVDPRQRLPARRTHEGHRDLGGRHRRRAARSARSCSGLLLAHFWYGSVFLVNVPIVTTALIAGWFLVPKSRDPRRPASIRSARVLSIVGIVAIVYGLIEAPEKGWTSTRHARRVRGRRSSSSPLFVLWELHTDEPMLDIRFFRNPAFSTGTGGMVLDLHVDVRRDVPHDPVLPADPRLQPARRRAPPAADGADHDHRLAVDTPPERAVRRQQDRRRGHGAASATGLLVLPRRSSRTRPYPYILRTLMLTTAGLRAGDVADDRGDHVGGARTTRRLGLGDERRVARARCRARRRGDGQPGRVAVPRRGRCADLPDCPAAFATPARASIAGALRVADGLPGRAGAILRAGAEAAFIDGIHLAVTVGALFAFSAALLVWRFLPRTLSHDGACANAGSRRWKTPPSSASRESRPCSPTPSSPPPNDTRPRASTHAGRRCSVPDDCRVHEAVGAPHQSVSGTARDPRTSRRVPTMIVHDASVSGPHNPVVPAPPRVPGSLRRTSTIDTFRPDGFDGEAQVVAQARDALTNPDGSVTTVATARVDARLRSRAHNLLAIESDPSVPGLQDLLDAVVGPGFRGRVDAAVPELRDCGELLYLLLDDLPGATLVSGYAMLHADAVPRPTNDEYLGARAATSAPGGPTTGR